MVTEGSRGVAAGVFLASKLRLGAKDNEVMSVTSGPTKGYFLSIQTSSDLEPNVSWIHVI